MTENAGASDGTGSRLVVREDLGGYGASNPALTSIAGVELVKPFVLLCGPNGSGKTSMLRMIRAAMGLTGERQGSARGDEFAPPIKLPECDGDLGKMAAWASSFRGGNLAKGLPGVLDVRALGWRGQRSWLFDSRSETQMTSAATFDDDIGYHASMIMGGASRRSHGEVLRGGWFRAVQWGLGLSDVPDAYDTPHRLPESRRELFKAVSSDAQRPSERWLLLDEPEAALDMDAQVVGLATLIRNAAFGSLRVFCASHSPLFAAGLADDPSVQVVDLGSRTKGLSWFSVQKVALANAADPATLDKMSNKVVENIKAHAEAERKAVADKAEADLTKAWKGLTPRLQAFIVLAAGLPDGVLPRALKTGTRLRDTDVMDMYDRGLVSNRREVTQLTPMGFQAAARIQALGLPPYTPPTPRKKAAKT